MPESERKDATETSAKIRWRDWSREAFQEAKATKRLILLDLSAEWCHWCHVMDQTTYSEPGVVETINDRFIPVRVDIDKRPDISDRYNRGGFPTTAFLSDQGEPIWGATYVPPDDMKNVLKAMIEASERGEVDAALEQERMHYLDLSKALEMRERVDTEFVDAVFEDIFAAYDVEWGGFGREPKFPHGSAIDLLLERYARTNDAELASAVESTLDHMTDGLYDEVEGGVFRYSVTRDWKVPHFEKMLETNLGFLRNLARARVVLDEPRFEKTARGVADYLLRVLREPSSGAFFSSQDADEEYYKLGAGERAHRSPPKVITEVFSGLNCRAVSTMSEAGILLNRSDLLDTAKRTWQVTLKELWVPARKLVRHRAGEDLYLFEDQVDLLEALIAIAETEPDSESQRTLSMAEDLRQGVDSSFSSADGGYNDVVRERDAIGKLAEPERNIVANSRWSKSLALLSAAIAKPDLAEQASLILESFPQKRVQANGIFSSDYVLAWDVLAIGPKSVEVHGTASKDLTEDDLWSSAKKALHPSAVVLPARVQLLELSPQKTFAVICQKGGCSKEIFEPAELARLLKPTNPGQI